MGLDYSDEGDQSWLTKPDDFKPGTMGCHEALHTVSIIQNLVEQELSQHPAICMDREWKADVDHIQAALYRLYSSIGAKHLA